MIERCTLRPAPHSTDPRDLVVWVHLGDRHIATLLSGGRGEGATVRVLACAPLTFAVDDPGPTRGEFRVEL